ncbi:MAG: peptide chain release factor aRF-1 [Candidatus Bathyarchaeota archaeon]|nr:peptide chain release factor aRF-1 [Candidatus Bathyarchaeota archaeon]
MTPEKITHFYGCQLTTSKSVKQHKLRKLIAWLSDKQASEKEYVSVYIPGGKTLDDAVAALKKELELVADKSEIAHGALQEAFKNLIQRLKLHETVPENGLVMFAGYLPENNPEYKSLEIKEIIPPEPINNYICIIDNHFQLEPLRDLLRDQRIVGILAVDSKNASLGLVRGGSLRVLDCITSGIPGKTGKGGQSQRRYERERDMELTSFFHRVAEHAAKEFLLNNRVTALVIGGPGQTKTDFLKGDYLNYELQNAVLSIVDTQSAGEEALREMQSKSSSILTNMCGPEEKKIMEKLLLELNKQSGLAVCGLDPVLDGLKVGAVEVALVTDTSDLAEYYTLCKKCGNTKIQILNRRDTQAIRVMVSTPCGKCHATEYEVVEKDMVDVLEDAASQTNARVEVIFTDSEEKAKLQDLGGFAAILRYKTSTS